MRNANEDLLAIERIKRGDAEFFTRLYKKYSDKVYGFSYRMLGDQTAAEDVTHEVLLLLIQHPEKYQPERGSLLTFLCAIARNYILNQFQRRNFEIEGGFDEEEWASIKDEFETDPLSFLLQQGLTAKVDEYISLLPPLQREVIILRKFGEMSYQEISEVIDTDVNVVKARLHRARQSLAKTLAPYINAEWRALS